MRNTTLSTYTRFAALLTAVAAACMGTGYAGGWRARSGTTGPNGRAA